MAFPGSEGIAKHGNERAADGGHGNLIGKAAEVGDGGVDVDALDNAVGRQAGESFGIAGFGSTDNER